MFAVLMCFSLLGTRGCKDGLGGGLRVFFAVAPWRYVDAHVNEQSRPIRDLDRGERDALIQSTSSVLPDHSDAWLRHGPSSQGAQASHPS